MNLSRRFIDHPIGTSLVMAAILLAGIVAFVNLPIAALPAVEFPTIQVNANLPGADPETMASAVASPLENQLSTIQGIDTMTSSSVQGRTTIAIAHRLSTLNKADRLVVMERGVLVEQGTHADLIARGGLYASLAALQFATMN